MKRSISIYLSIVLLASFPGNPSASSHAAVPFEKLGHLILVRASINGSKESYNLVLDFRESTVIFIVTADCPERSDRRGSW